MAALPARNQSTVRLHLTLGCGSRIISLHAVAGIPGYSLQLVILIIQVDLPQPFCFDSDQVMAACDLSRLSSHFKPRMQ
jgi:hypothetical protein